MNNNNRIGFSGVLEGILSGFVMILFLLGFMWLISINGMLVLAILVSALFFTVNYLRGKI